MSKTNPLVVINVVGLTAELIGKHTPNINKAIAEGFIGSLTDAFPAVTTTSQSSMLTGTMPSDHGIVGNGWYFRDTAEVAFWKQSNSLVQGDKVWDKLKQQHKDFKVSKLFWWYNMYANVDATITPRPHYPADGRKVLDLYSTPTHYHQNLEEKIGKFPFFNFWGPKADIRSSEWIAKVAMLDFDEQEPDLQLVYLPHLDYNLQRLGPSDPKIWQDVADIDRVVGKLIEHVKSKGAEVYILSEYGINDVNHPVHINRVLRENGFIATRDTLHWEMLDPGASKAFAVSDHQIAHIYINDPRSVSAIQTLLENTPGIATVLNHETKKDFHLDHERAGDLIAIAEPSAWFTYYYWLDDDKAPDFARTVDIHRKPGYDPVELFIDPQIKFPIIKIAFRVLQKHLGFRMLMDTIPLDASLIKGSHGRLVNTAEKAPLFIGPKHLAADHRPITDVHDLILAHFE